MVNYGSININLRSYKELFLKATILNTTHLFRSGKRMNGKKANTINRYKYFHHVNHQKIQQSSKKTLWASLIITLLFTVIEFVGGLVSNSLALLSDSFHMLSDVQLVIKLNGNVDEVYQQLQRLIKNANVEESENTDNINSQDTSYTPQVKVTTPILVKAPIAGRRILLKEVRDSIFREKMVGEGLAIKAHEESKVIAPFNGLISMIVPTKHAVGIQSEDGVDIVIHIGVNTVDLEGKGFKCFVKQNDHVEAGQTLLQFDQQYIQQQGYNADVIVVISNSADLGKVELTMNEIITTEDVIFKIFKN